MAVQRRPNGTLMPGSVNNPHGGQMHSYEVKMVRKLTLDEFASLAQLVVEKDYNKISEMAETKEGQPFLFTMIAKCLKVAYSRGDWGTCDAILSRIIGKSVEKIEKVENPFKSLSDEEKLTKAKELVASLEAKLGVIRPDPQ